MERIEYLEIEGTKYPLCWTMGAMEELVNAYGGRKALSEKMKDGSDFGVYMRILETIMRYGVERLRRTEKDVPDALTIEEMRLIFNLDDQLKIIAACNNAFHKSQGNEVKGKPVGKKKETE